MGTTLSTVDIARTSVRKVEDYFTNSSVSGRQRRLAGLPGRENAIHCL
jgi:hypothetical protein